MVKRCSWGTCKSDTRYPDRVEGVVFLPFPKPKRKLQRCKEWIHLCRKPPHQLNLSTITKDTYVCSKHFVDGGPTPEFPNPVDARESSKPPSRPPPRWRDSSKPPKAHRPQPRWRNRTTATVSSQNRGDNLETGDPLDPGEQPHSGRETRERLVPGEHPHAGMKIGEPLGPGEHPHPGIETGKPLVPREHPHPGTRIGEHLVPREHPHPRMEPSFVSEVQYLKSIICQQSDQIKLQKKQLSEFQFKGLTPEMAHFNGEIPNYFEYCTGFKFAQFNHLCSVLKIPISNTAPQRRIPLTYPLTTWYTRNMPLRSQLLMVLMKLRNNYDIQDLAFKFRVNMQSASMIFNAWVSYMFNRLGEIVIWPHRDVIAASIPAGFKKDYPTTLAILDCIELNIESSTSPLLQSQSYSEYKSTSTLRGLVACDPCGSVLFVSTLFTGSISEREIFRQSNITTLLSSLIGAGCLAPGDSIMADKGFFSEEEVEAVGLPLHSTPFTEANTRMPAKHKVHVERCIARIKRFKIVSGRIPSSMVGSISQIWCVVSLLTTFQPPDPPQ